MNQKRIVSGKQLLKFFFTFFTLILFAVSSLQAQNVMGDNEYDNLIKQADQHFSAKQFVRARTAYQQALKLNPDSQYAKAQIKKVQAEIDKQLDSEIDDLLLDDSNSEEKEKKYRENVDKANALFDKKKYDEAKKFYQLALSFVPDEDYPQQRLEAIDKLIIEQQGEVKFKEFVAKGDAALKLKKYPDAKAAYEEAKKYKSGDPYPAQKIAEIDKALEEQAKGEKLENDYKAAISKGETAFSAKKYDEAKTSFEQAASLKPNEKLPKDKIALIDAEIAKEAKAEQVEKDFKAAMDAGDKALVAKDLDNAKKSFIDAQKLKPNDAGVATKLKDVEAQLANKLKEEKLTNDFQAAIKQGDDAFAKKDYNMAKSAYNQALTLKPNEKYPKDKIAESDKLLGDLAAQKKLDDDYNAAISNAENLFAQKKYNEAKIAFETALKLKPNEQVPKTKIGDIIKLMEGEAKQAELDKKYTETISKADEALKAEKLAEAKTAYTEAAALKANEQYPKTKLTEVEKLIADKARNEKLEADYQAAMKEGETKFAAKDLNASKAAFENASKLKPSETLPKTKISEVEKLIADKMAGDKLETDYQNAMKKADDAFAKKDYTNAKSLYGEALKIKPNEKLPADKIAESDKLLGELANQKKQDEDYAAAIKSGEDAFGAKKYDDAKIAYENALKIKPNEAAPKAKIAEITKLIEADAKQTEINNKFNDLMSKAEAAFGSKDLANAKKIYQEASVLKPNENLPKTKIADIDKLIAEQQNQEKLEADYQAAMKEGEAKLTAKDLNAAKAAFEKAVNLKASETLPKEKLKEVNDLITQKQQSESIEAGYAAAIKKADEAFAKKDYNNSKAGYNEALKFKPSDKYSLDKIAEADKNLAELSSQKKLDDDYNSKMVTADAFLNSKKYNEAKAEFEAALALKPNESTPKTKIAEIVKIIEEQNKNQALLNQFEDLMKNAENAFKSKDYQTAKGLYNQALGLKSDDGIAKARIDEIDKIIENEAKNLENQKAFENAIAQAEKALNEKKFDESLSAFKKASSLKDNDKYSVEKIKEVEKIIADKALADKNEQEYKSALSKADEALFAKDFQKAKTLFETAQKLNPSDSYPKEKLELINKELEELNKNKALNEKYQAIIQKADEALAAKDYKKAKGLFGEAITAKPEETYPSQKIREIDDAILAIEKEKKTEEDYKTAIAAADKALEAKDYQTAVKLYNDARLLKTNETYPNDRIAQINKITAEENKKKESDLRYNAAVERGDKAFDKKDWESAIIAYEEALIERNFESHPRKKMEEAKLEQKKKQDSEKIDADYLEAILEGDKLMANKDYKASKQSFLKAQSLKSNEKYPKEKIAELERLIEEAEKKNALEDKYNQAIASGDNYFGQKNYQMAKTNYLEAQKLKSSEEYPGKKLAEIENILADLAKQEEINAKYKKVIDEADKLFVSEKYQNAIEKYNEALTIKSSEKYPNDKIAEINRIMNDAEAAKKLEEEYLRLVAEGDASLKTKKYEEALTSYTEAQKLKPSEQYPKIKIDEINIILSKKEQKKNISEEQYKKAIADGDENFNAKKYVDARENFSSALALKPSEKYPQDKLAEIKKLLDEKDGFEKLVIQADKLYDDNKPFDALSKYFQANKLKPEDAHVTLRINELKERLKAKTEEIKNEPAKPRPEYISRSEKLAKEYPQGITQETKDLPEYEKQVVRKIVVDGDKAREFTKVIYKFGTFYFTEDGTPISEYYWDKAEEFTKDSK